MVGKDAEMTEFDRETYSAEVGDGKHRLHNDGVYAWIITTVAVLIKKKMKKWGCINCG